MPGPLADIDFARNLSDFYSKHIGKAEFTDIREEAKRDNPQASLYLSGPLIQRGAQRGAENKSRSGIRTQIELGAADILRVGKFLASPKGLLHLLKRFGLSKMQPYVGGGSNPLTVASNKANRNFNPLTIPLQGAAGVLGIHTHPLFPIAEPSYLLDVQARNIAGVNNVPKIGNRLLDLQIKYMGTSGYSVFPPKVGLPAGPTPSPKPFTGGPSLISLSPGGPNSLFGFGATGIFKSNSGNSSFEATVFYHPGSTYDPKDPAKLAQNPSIKHVNPTTNKAISVPDNVDDLKKNSPVDITQYKTLAYGDLKKSESATLIQDFRKIAGSNYHEVTLPDYGTKNIATRLGLPNYGERRGVSDDNATLEANYDKGFSDLITLKIAGIQFRAYIDGAITDSVNFGYSEVNYVGAYTPAYVYDKGTRNWALTLKMPSFTAVELSRNKAKVNDLIQKCSPSIKDGRAIGAQVRITLGNFWSNIPTIIDRVDMTVEDTTPWDIAFGEKEKETTGEELPMHLTLALSGKFLQNITNGQTYIGS